MQREGQTPLTVAVVPARNEAARIGATLAALQQLASVSRIVVVDDGSSDDTGAIARDAGATVVRQSRSDGKAAALAAGAAVAPEAEFFLFADADLGESASALDVLVAPVAAGEADLTIAILPPQVGSGGGRGRVVTLAREGIERATGWTATQPLSGMRCLNRAAFDAATPFARGWGVETAMTIDVLDAGLRVLEVPCDLQHRVTGKDVRGTLHRAAQYRDVQRALRRRTRTRLDPDDE